MTDKCYRDQTRECREGCPAWIYSTAEDVTLTNCIVLESYHRTYKYQKKMLDNDNERFRRIQDTH